MWVAILRNSFHYGWNIYGSFVYRDYILNYWPCLSILDPYEDQFEKKVKEKKERVAKNELQRLRNIARNQKGGAGIDKFLMIIIIYILFDDRESTLV